MAAVYQPVTNPSEYRFFVAMAGLCAVIAFAGFAGTYWLQLPAGTFTGSPLLHLHGLLFSAWTLFFLLQAFFIARGRFLNHRAWGLFGIALASVMLFTGIAVASSGLNERLGHGHGDAARAFVIVPLSTIFLFAGFVAAAIARRRRSDWHKRLMLSATAVLIVPAFARFFFLSATGGGAGARPGVGPPLPVEFAVMPGLLAALVIVIAMLSDWRTRGRPHPAYVWGLGLTVAVQLLRIPLSRTDGWMAFADFMANFAG